MTGCTCPAPDFKAWQHLWLALVSASLACHPPEWSQGQWLRPPAGPAGPAGALWPDESHTEHSAFDMKSRHLWQPERQNGSIAWCSSISTNEACQAFGPNTWMTGGCRILGRRPINSSSTPKPPMHSSVSEPYKRHMVSRTRMLQPHVAAWHLWHLRTLPNRSDSRVASTQLSAACFPELWHGHRRNQKCRGAREASLPA